VVPAGGKVGTSGPLGDISFNYKDNVDVAVVNNGKGSPTVRTLCKCVLCEALAELLIAGQLALV
jgi:hypothetical protein